jgi:hypothetical protein
MNYQVLVSGKVKFEDEDILLAYGVAANLKTIGFKNVRVRHPGLMNPGSNKILNLDYKRW